MRLLIPDDVRAADGSRMNTQVTLPDGPGPFPTLLFRCPYNIEGWLSYRKAPAERGYAVVAQDCRGKYGSEGTYEAVVYDAGDGQLLVDWVSRQSWCGGIGMFGFSYMGLFQVPAAAGGNAAIRCIAPAECPVSFFHDFPRLDGCLRGTAGVDWAIGAGELRTRPLEDAMDYGRIYRSTHIEQVEALSGVKFRLLKTWAEHDVCDEYWKAIDQNGMHRSVNVPALHVAGWWDLFQRGPVDAFRSLRQNAGTRAARAGQKLVIGPWDHRDIGLEAPAYKLGEWEFGTDAGRGMLDYASLFLDYHMKGVMNGVDTWPPVQVFLMGENRWIGLEDWPPPGTEYQEWYLHSTGRSATDVGDGELSRDRQKSSATVTFLYDPANPLPTTGGQSLTWQESVAGPTDERRHLKRPDVLYYRSAKLGQPLTVAGDIELALRVSSSAEDTDFTARFCVEEPGGRVAALTNGVARCRYREGWDRVVPLVPGHEVDVRLRLNHTAYTFPTGSRIGLMVSSSDCPRIIPHHNTMAKPLAEHNPKKAENTVHHGPEGRSFLRLPVGKAL